MEIRLTTHRTRAADLNGTITAASDTYLISGTSGASDEEILQKVLELAPGSCGTAYLDGARIVSDEGGGVLKVEVRYASSDESFSNYRYRRVKRSGDRVWSFDVSCHSETVTHGLKLVQMVNVNNRFSPGNAINWNGKTGPAGEIKGTKRLSPAMTEECVATFKADEITTAYKRTLLKLTGCVNNAPFHGWEKGEILFLGASQGSSYQNDRKEWLTDVSFHFAIRPNAVSPQIGGVYLSGTVEGWDYPWLIEESSVAPDNGRPASRRIGGVYLSRIYRRADFNRLALGSSNEDEIHIRLVRKGR